MITKKQKELSQMFERNLSSGISAHINMGNGYSYTGAYLYGIQVIMSDILGHEYMSIDMDRLVLTHKNERFETGYYKH